MQGEWALYKQRTTVTQKTQVVRSDIHDIWRWYLAANHTIHTLEVGFGSNFSDNLRTSVIPVFHNPRKMVEKANPTHSTMCG